jgi:hypothetical protein
MSSGQLSVNKEIMKHQLLLLNDQKDHLISSDLINNSIFINERIMMAITRKDDFVSRAEGEWRNSSERVIAIIRE